MWHKFAPVFALVCYCEFFCLTLGSQMLIEDPIGSRTLKWVKSHGAEVKNIVVGINAFGRRGVFFDHGAQLGENGSVLSIPRELWLHDGLMSSELNNTLNELEQTSGQGFEKASKFSALLAMELLKGSKSFWEPYFAMLPPFDSATTEERYSLYGVNRSQYLSGLWRHRSQQEINVREHYEKHIAPALLNQRSVLGIETTHQAVILNALLQADQICRRRVWLISDKNIGHVLIPILDAVNHQSTALPMDGVLQGRAHLFRHSDLKNVPKRGDEVFLLYKNFACKGLQLLFYDFVDDQSEADCILFNFKFGSSATLNSTKGREILDKYIIPLYKSKQQAPDFGWVSSVDYELVDGQLSDVQFNSVISSQNQRFVDDFHRILCTVALFHAPVGRLDELADRFAVATNRQKPFLDLNHARKTLWQLRSMFVAMLGDAPDPQAVDSDSVDALLTEEMQTAKRSGFVGKQAMDAVLRGEQALKRHLTKSIELLWASLFLAEDADVAHSIQVAPISASKCKESS
jgi:hypothetical protein